jgi:hypothetical protein
VDLNITVNGTPLATAAKFGDVEMSTVWPGGSDELSWAVTNQPSALSTGGLLVKAFVGPWCVWGGTLLEPDPSQDRMVAQGLWRLGDRYEALTSGLLATATPDTAIDQGIARGALPWTRSASLSSTAVDVDVSQKPLMIGELLDAWTEQSAKRWGVDAFGNAFAKVDETTPTYRVLPLDGGLGFALDGYACRLFGAYYNGTSYAIADRSDTVAQALHGYAEGAVDLTVRGTLTSTKANTILDNILALGRSTPQWTTSISVGYGELLTMNGSPVMLETVQAGKVLRVPGGLDFARSNYGQMYVDMLIGSTSLSDGLLTIQPMQTAARSFTDVITKALTKKK